MPAAAAALQGLAVAAFLLRASCALQFNTTGANSVKFPNDPAEALFTQIATDLHRFTKTGIHIDMVEQPYCSEREPRNGFSFFSCSILSSCYAYGSLAPHLMKLRTSLVIKGTEQQLMWSLCAVRLSGASSVWASIHCWRGH